MIHDRIINFLKDKAWEEVFQATNKKWQAPSSVAKFCVLSPPKELGLPERWNLSIPVNPDTIDYEDFIATRIKVIADIYGVSIEYIQNQIFASKDTVLSIRIYDEETSEGTIAFTRFENLMEGVKKILVDTASFVLETKNGFENQNEIAQQYLSRCAFLQTEKGSFIANIQLPSETTIEDMTSQKQLIPSKEINDKLNDVLTFVSKEILVEDKDKVSDEFIKQNEDKINIALLRDIKEFYASAGIKNVDFSFITHQDTTVIQSQEINEQKIKNLTLFIKRADKYMESKTQEMDVMGYVVALSSKNHEKKHKNSVKISVRLEEELAVFVVSQLPEAKYNQAIDAHKQGILLRIKGKVKKEKKQYRFVEIENFTLNSK